MKLLFSYRVLDSVVYGINTSVQTVTKYTPFYLMYLREARAPHAISTYHEGMQEVGLDIEHNGRLANDAIAHAINSCIEVNKTVSKEILNLEVDLTCKIRC